MLQPTLKRVVKLVLLSCLVSGCAVVGKSLDWQTELAVSFHVWQDLNPNDSGRASPLVVRLYELRDPEVFLSADFLELYQSDIDLLGEDLIAQCKLTEFQPGYDRKAEFYISESARYVGLLGEFSQFEGARDRIVIALDPHLKNHETVTLKHNGLLMGRIKETTRKLVQIERERTL